MRIFFFLFLSIFVGFCKDLEPKAIPTTVAGTPPAQKPSELFYQYDDASQTWQDISATLPKGVDIQKIYTFGNENYIISSHGNLYRSDDLLKGRWEKESIFPFITNPKNKGESVWHIFKLSTGTYTSIYEKGLYKRISPNTWLPIQGNLTENVINSLVETVDKAIAISTKSGIYKSYNEGKTWQQVLNKEWTSNLSINNGVLLAVYPDGIIRSTDNGANWETVHNEKDINFTLAVEDNHFIAFRNADSYNNELALGKARCSYTSPDAGKTWQCIDALFSPVEGLYDYKKVNNILYCSTKKGVFSSNDNGASWKMQLPIPTVKDKAPRQLTIIPYGKSILVARTWNGC